MAEGLKGNFCIGDLAWELELELEQVAVAPSKGDTVRSGLGETVLPLTVDKLLVSTNYLSTVKSSKSDVLPFSVVLISSMSFSSMAMSSS